MITKKLDKVAIAEVNPSRDLKPAYCDYIADCIKHALHERKNFAVAQIIADVGPVKWDLHPTEGYFISPKKTIAVTDRNGKVYRITVEEEAP